MRVLCVESDENLRQQLQDVLKGSYYSVSFLDDASQLVALMQRADVAIVETVDTPVGNDTIARLRAEGIYTPIIVLSRLYRWADIVASLDAGADDYMSKPFHLAELMARVRVNRKKHGWNP